MFVRDVRHIVVWIVRYAPQPIVIVPNVGTDITYVLCAIHIVDRRGRQCVSWSQQNLRLIRSLSMEVVSISRAIYIYSYSSLYL